NSRRQSPEGRGDQGHERGAVPLPEIRLRRPDADPRGSRPRRLRPDYHPCEGTAKVSPAVARKEERGQPPGARRTVSDLAVPGERRHPLSRWLQGWAVRLTQKEMVDV